MAPSLKETAKKNRSQLGDPTSLKAETSKLVPTEGEEGADKKSLKDVAQDSLKNNKSALGDPVSLKAETADSEPTDQDRGARGPSKNNGKPKI